MPPVYAVFTEDITKTLVSNRDDKIVMLETKQGDNLKLKFPDRAKAFEWKVDICKFFLHTCLLLLLSYFAKYMCV